MTVERFMLDVNINGIEQTREFVLASDYEKLKESIKSSLQIPPDKISEWVDKFPKVDHGSLWPFEHGVKFVGDALSSVLEALD